MQDLLFYILYICPLVILGLYRDKNGPHVFQVNCANILMLFYIIANHIGLLFLYLNPDGIKQLTSVNKETVILLAFYSFIVVVSYIITGKTLGVKFVSVRIPKINDLRKDKINWLPITLVFLVAAAIAYAKVKSNSPLLMLLEGDPHAAGQLRLEGVTEGSSLWGLKSSYIDIILNVLRFTSILALIVLMVRQKKTKYILLYLSISFVFGLYHFANVSKGFISTYAYIILFTYSLIYTKGVLLNKVLLYSLAFALTVIATFSAWVMGNDIIQYLYPLERLTLGNLISQYVVVDSFSMGNLLLGTSVPGWFTFGLHDQFLLDVFAWQSLSPWAKDVFYTAPSSFVAEAHANFYVFGVLLSSFFVFFMLRIVDYFIKKIKSEMLYVAVMVHSCLVFSYMSVSGMISNLINYKYLAVLLFAFFFYRVKLRTSKAYGHIDLNKIESLDKI